jgi:hypothetical protein
LGAYYADGLVKHFEQAPTRSKHYFAALAVAARVLAKLAVDDTVVSVVYHGMT